MAAAGGARRSAAVPPTSLSNTGRKNPLVRCRAWHEEDYMFSVADGGVVCLSLPFSEVCMVSATLSDMALVECTHAVLPSPLTSGRIPICFYLLYFGLCTKNATTLCVFVPGMSTRVFPSATIQIMRERYPACFVMPPMIVSMISALRAYTLPKSCVCIF